MPDVISLSLPQLFSPRVRSQITEMAGLFMSEAAYPGVFNEAHFFKQMQSSFLAGVVEIYAAMESEIPVAVLGAAFVPDIFSGLRTGSEIFWFVHPASRSGSKSGILLFNFFETRCAERGCKLQVMAHMEGLRAAPLKELYKRRGYSPAEQFFRKVI